MKVVKENVTARVSSGLLEDICIPETLVKCMTIEMIETIHLDKLSKQMQNKVIKSLRLGCHDAAGGLSSVIYRTLCELHKIPDSKVSADRVHIKTRNEHAIADISAKDLLIRSARGSRSQTYYSHKEDTAQGAIAMHSTSHKNSDNYYIASGWNCGIKRDELAHYITTDYLMEHNDAVEAAIQDVRNGEKLIFKTKSGV